MEAITPAKINWDANDFPVSEEFGDVYFSRKSGIEESRYVFLKHNELPGSWLESDSYTILEAGFGSGLNFLVTWDEWLKNPPRAKQAILNYISIEKYPFTKEDMEKSHCKWSELVNLSAALLDNYPDISPGIHQIILNQGRVVLTLIYGDIRDILHELQVPSGVNSWFLDGFAPAKNPEMWGNMLAQSMERLSAENASYATFTAAGAVRRALNSAGFTVNKTKGYGHKRDMISGGYVGNEIIDKPKVRAKTIKTAIIVGGGLAGCSVAYAFASRGIEVTLIERNARLALAASGNPAGILFPMLHKSWDPLAAFYMAGYGTTRRLIKTLQADGHEVEAQFCGMIQFPKDERQAEYFSDLPEMLKLDKSLAHILTRAESAELLGLQEIEINKDAIYFPQGGWVNVRSFCNALTQHDEIEIIQNSEIAFLEKDNERWIFKDNKGASYQGDIAVIANADDANIFEQTKHIKLHTIRGQISYIPSDQISKPLNKVICGGGYVTPEISGFHYLGATFDRNRTDADVDISEHFRNHSKILGFLPESMTGELNPELWDGRVAFRTISKDRCPIVGRLDENLYISTAHTSRGIISCPIAANAIVSKVFGECSLFSPEIEAIISPSRF